MKKLQEIKNTYAQEHGYEDWDDLSEKNNYVDDYEFHWTNVCIRAQKEYRDNILQKIQKYKICT